MMAVYMSRNEMKMSHTCLIRLFGWKNYFRKRPYSLILRSGDYVLRLLDNDASTRAIDLDSLVDLFEHYDNRAYEEGALGTLKPHFFNMLPFLYFH